MKSAYAVFMDEGQQSPIISYNELVMRERQNLQKGMNFRKDGRLSVFLMSSRHNAPYKDEWRPEEQVLIYEGHDASNDSHTRKSVDQPMYRESGKLSDNGSFITKRLRILTRSDSIHFRYKCMRNSTVQNETPRQTREEKGTYWVQDVPVIHRPERDETGATQTIQKRERMTRFVWLNFFKGAV